MPCRCSRTPGSCAEVGRAHSAIHSGRLRRGHCRDAVPDGAGRPGRRVRAGAPDQGRQLRSSQRADDVRRYPRRTTAAPYRFGNHTLDDCAMVAACRRSSSRPAPSCASRVEEGRSRPAGASDSWSRGCDRRRGSRWCRCHGRRRILRRLVRHVMADGAAGSRTEDGVVPGHVASDGAHRSAFEAALGRTLPACRPATRARRRRQQRTS